MINMLVVGISTVRAVGVRMNFRFLNGIFNDDFQGIARADLIVITGGDRDRLGTLDLREASRLVHVSRRRKGLIVTRGVCTANLTVRVSINDGGTSCVGRELSITLRNVFARVRSILIVCFRGTVYGCVALASALEGDDRELCRMGVFLVIYEGFRAIVNEYEGNGDVDLSSYTSNVSVRFREDQLLFTHLSDNDSAIHRTRLVNKVRFVTYSVLLVMDLRGIFIRFRNRHGVLLYDFTRFGVRVSNDGLITGGEGQDGFAYANNELCVTVRTVRDVRLIAITNISSGVVFAANRTCSYAYGDRYRRT